ncbi:type II toxin-antitoxin system VapC family toxin [Candidatus Poriferisocius sp.]|uniref:type II toxin-antitoxin system VapC family toxin n=1 Tax=Candidatus Poriferisocius sp. TaxID=3101276 RepID=UPI003B5A346D
MILADTSAWVDYDRGNCSPAHLQLAALIAEGGHGLVVTEPVLMEVLAGAKNSGDYEQLRSLLTSLAWIPVDPIADFEGAAQVYRGCRRRGVTPRGMIDCMIATIALRVGAEVLTTDQDMRRIADVFPLRLASAAP